VTILQGRLLAVRAGRDRREATWRNPRLFPTIEKGPGKPTPPGPSRTCSRVGRLRVHGRSTRAQVSGRGRSDGGDPSPCSKSSLSATNLPRSRRSNNPSKPTCASLARCHPKHRPPKSSIIAAASNPGRNHRHIVRVEGHQVGAISGGELAEHVSETDRHRRIC
jgi:hypothetical protein